MSTGDIRNDRIARFVEMTSVEHEAATLEEMFQRMTSRISGVDGAEGRPEGLPAICAAWGVPYGKYMYWLKAEPKRYQVYLDALDAASRADISEVIAIADGDGFPQNKRVRIETRFRVAEAHAREMYGRREEQAPSTLVLVADLDRVADALLSRLAPPVPGRTIEHESESEGEI